MSFQSNNNTYRQETWLKQDETMMKFHDLDLIFPISTSTRVLNNGQYNLQNKHQKEALLRDKNQRFKLKNYANEAITAK